MNFINDLIQNFQEFVAQVPEWVQPLIVALAGAVPFIEGEGAAAIGIIGGINPIVAAIAGAAGNFICVALLILITSGVRGAVTSRQQNAEQSPRKQKFRRAFEKYGTPGVSLLGPLLLPTHFNAVLLVGSGVRKSVVLFWQAIAIVLWTTVITLLFIGVLNLATN